MLFPFMPLNIVPSPFPAAGGSGASAGGADSIGLSVRTVWASVSNSETRSRAGGWGGGGGGAAGLASAAVSDSSSRKRSAAFGLLGASGGGGGGGGACGGGGGGA